MPEIKDKLLTVKEAQIKFEEAGICGRANFFKVYRSQLEFKFYGVDPKTNKATDKRIPETVLIRKINEIQKNPVA